MAEEKGEQKLEVMNPRAEMFAQIEANNLEKIKKEIEEGGGDPKQLEAEQPEEKPAEDSPAEEPKEESKAEETPKEEKPVEKTYKIKVDGKEQEVPESVIVDRGIKTLQKETAADERIKEATRLLAEAKETIGKGRLPEGADKPREVPTETDHRAIAHAIQYGSEEEASKALKQLASAPQGLTADQAATLVDERVAFRTAVDWYKRECKDIADDPYLHQLFLVKEREKRQAGDNRPYLEVYGDITKELRDWRGTITPKPQADPLADKRERKATVIPHPKAASAKPPASTETKEPSPSDVIADMRKARHQA